MPAPRSKAKKDAPPDGPAATSPEPEAAPADLPVHPLVMGLAAFESSAGTSVVQASAVALDCAHTFYATRAAGGWGATTKHWDQMQPQTDIDTFCAGANTYVLVAGYLGGTVHVTSASLAQGQITAPMRVLFLDSGLATWLLISLDDIRLFNRAKDGTAAFGLRDILWLRPEARVVRGDRSESILRSYLNGPFVRAEDLSSIVSSGTYPRAPGLLLEATTPACCTKTRR